jgi:hypothetical protein
MYTVRELTLVSTVYEVYMYSTFTCTRVLYRVLYCTRGVRGRWWALCRVKKG